MKINASKRERAKADHHVSEAKQKVDTARILCTVVRSAGSGRGKEVDRAAVTTAQSLQNIVAATEIAATAATEISATARNTNISNTINISTPAAKTEQNPRLIPSSASGTDRGSSNRVRRLGVTHLCAADGSACPKGRSDTQGVRKSPVSQKLALLLLLQRNGHTSPDVRSGAHVTGRGREARNTTNASGFEMNVSQRKSSLVLLWNRTDR